MTDKNSFLPFVSFALIVGGGVFVGLAWNWGLGALAAVSGVSLVFAAAAFAVVLALVSYDKITGEFMLIPAGLTAVGMLLHCINMITVKGSFGLRVEMLLTVVFVVMVLIMIGSFYGWKNLSHKTTVVICAIICGVSLIACFMPLVLFVFDGRQPVDIFTEIVTTNLPLIFYFAAYFTYFIAVKHDGGAA